MTRPSPLWINLRKDAHALWPAWAASVAVLVAAAVADSPRFDMPGRLAYLVGSVTLAALALGHEYTHGTLPVLLSLPFDRRRLLLGKLLVVVPMLATLAALTLTAGPGPPFFERGTFIASASVLCAITLAPWLTMLCRSPLAGAVFALVATGMMHIAALAAVIAWYEWIGPTAAGMEALRDDLLTTGLAAACVLSAVVGWHLFMRLEAIDGRDADVSWPSWLRSAITREDLDPLASARRASPIWLLVKKELRIQQLALVVAGVNVLIWVALSALGVFRDSVGTAMEAVGVLYGGLLAILIGALASAEERRMGTLEWQTLLPVAAWQQWSVKTAVTLSLTLLLSFALPIVLAAGEMGVSPWHAATAVVMTIGGLYVSSLSDSGLTALAIAAPAVIVVLLLLGSSLSLALSDRASLLAAVTAGVAALAWWFAFLNHRSARPESSRVGWQLAAMAAAPLLLAIIARS